MNRSTRTLATMVAVLTACTLISASAVVAAAKKPRSGSSSQAVDRQEIAWRVGKDNRVFTESKKWETLFMPSGGCPVDGGACGGSSFPGLLIRARGEISVTFSGNFSRAPVELRLRDAGRLMRPGGVKFKPRPGGNSFSFTFVSDRHRKERVCDEVTFQWRSPTGEPVHLNKATVVVHYKHFEPEEPVGCV